MSAREEKKVDVPDLVGKTTDEATAALSALGLSLGNVTEEYSDEYEAGKIISQKKEAGSKVDKGTAVDYVLSKGPEKKMVNVPTLIGKREDAAYQALIDAGLTGAAIEWRYDPSIEYGYVISQTVTGSVEEGTEVGYAVSLGKDPATEPENPLPQPDPEEDPNGGISVQP